ncbi:uncharacterized protein LOC121408363 [Lytechinus variegatus]|uniref:uncharacterized protein LOC121408363 n=1 Tax=Lytechinus variegatus TaxID=7654 RepID=UPI001BB251E9|nr:uncharacterized protein LOC121408363 [Lytechinus variegatus]
MDESDATDEDMEDEASTSKKDVRKRVGKADRSAMAELLKKKKTEDQRNHKAHTTSMTTISLHSHGPSTCTHGPEAERCPCISKTCRKAGLSVIPFFLFGNKP